MDHFKFYILDSDDNETEYRAVCRVHPGRRARTWYERDQHGSIEVLSVLDASGVVVMDDALYAHAEELADELVVPPDAEEELVPDGPFCEDF